MSEITPSDVRGVLIKLTELIEKRISSITTFDTGPCKTIRRTELEWAAKLIYSIVSKLDKHYHLSKVFLKEDE